MTDQELYAGWSVERRFTHALGALPTILHNRLSDGSREPLAAALLSAIDQVGLRLQVKSDDGDETEWFEDKGDGIIGRSKYGWISK